MRKYIYKGVAALAAVLALAACDKEAVRRESVQQIDWSRARFVVNAAKVETDENGAQTRALKEDWKHEDEIVVLFGGLKERYVKIRYDEATQVWTRDKVNLTGLAPNGADAVSAIHSGDGLNSDLAGGLEVGTDTDLLYTDEGSYTVDATDPSNPVVFLTLSLHRAATTAIIMSTPEDETTTNTWRLWGEGLSAHSDDMLIDANETFTSFDDHVRAMFEPSSIDVPAWPDMTYQVDGEVVFHVMSTLEESDPVTFKVYKDTTQNYILDADETLYTRTFTGKELTAGKTIEIAGPSMPGAIAADKWQEVAPPTPTSWDDVQSAIDGTAAGGVLDISALPQFPDNDPDAEEITINVAKDITITAQMDPVLGKFGDGSGYVPFSNIYFVLADGATLTLDKASFNVSTDPKPLISGDGNVIVKDSSIFHRVPIDITGDVTVYGTIAKLQNANINFTTEIGSTQSDAPFVEPKSGIRARNVTINGGTVAGGTAFVPDGTVRGGTAIEASGDVTITGEMVEIDGGKYESIYILGGYGEYGNDGGDAIVVAGNLTVTGAAAIQGGNGTGDGARGGIGIIAGGDVTLSGSRSETAPDEWNFSVHVRPGTGVYQPGIPFKFSADGDGRTLTATTVMICGVNKNFSVTPPTGGYFAPYTMELQANDRALLEDCRIGWYIDVPIFSGGYYKITNQFIDTWGTDAKGTPMEGNEWVYVAPEP